MGIDVKKFSSLKIMLSLVETCLLYSKVIEFNIKFNGFKHHEKNCSFLPSELQNLLNSSPDVFPSIELKSSSVFFSSLDIAITMAININSKTRAPKIHRNQRKDDSSSSQSDDYFKLFFLPDIVIPNNNVRIKSKPTPAGRISALCAPQLIRVPSSASHRTSLSSIFVPRDHCRTPTSALPLRCSQTSKAFHSRCTLAARSNQLYSVLSIYSLRPFTIISALCAMLFICAVHWFACALIEAL